MIFFLNRTLDLRPRIQWNFDLTIFQHNHIYHGLYRICMDTRLNFDRCKELAWTHNRQPGWQRYKWCCLCLLRGVYQYQWWRLHQVGLIPRGRPCRGVFRNKNQNPPKNWRNSSFLRRKILQKIPFSLVLHFLDLSLYRANVFISRHFKMHGGLSGQVWPTNGRT